LIAQQKSLSHGKDLFDYFERNVIETLLVRDVKVPFGIRAGARSQFSDGAVKLRADDALAEVLPMRNYLICCKAIIQQDRQHSEI
jgi:hypothetical protein